jgi:hypothetical protein
MLTKDDLNQIGNILNNALNTKLEPVKKDITILKKDVSQTRKDVKVLIAYFDREYVDLRRRIEAIEQHLGLSNKN